MALQAAHMIEQLAAVLAQQAATTNLLSGPVQVLAHVHVLPVTAS